MFFSVYIIEIVFINNLMLIISNNLSIKNRKAVAKQVIEILASEVSARITEIHNFFIFKLKK